MSDRSFIARHRRGALKGVSLPRDAGFAVTAAPDAARFVLRGNPAAVVAFGIAPPERLQASAEGNRAAFWLGPDEFLLFAPGEDADIVRSSLEAGLTGEPYSLVDVSHRQIGLVLEGKRAARCLSAGCPLDLRPAAFPVGMVARTIFLKTEIVLWRRSAEQFHVEVWRSFAPYLVGHLAEAYAGTHGLQSSLF